MSTRRAFLQRGLLSFAGLAALPRRAVQASPQPAAPLTFDLHLHPGLFMKRGLADYAGDEAAWSTLRAMRSGGVHGGFVSLVADGPLIVQEATGVRVIGSYRAGEANAEFRRQLAIARELLPKGGARIVTTMTEFRRVVRDGETGAWLACEGCEFLDGDPGRVDVLRDAGIRSIQLVHYAPNAAGDLQTQPAQHGGLSSFGKAVVQRMRERRMLIDVAHATEATVADVVRLVDGPIILSHSLLRPSQNRPMAARTISASHARLVAETGGVIGAWPSRTNSSFADFVDSTKRLADLVGTAHIGLGTDMDGNLQPVMTGYAQFRDWTAGLASHGFTAEEVAQMAGGNMTRVLSGMMP